MNTTDAQATEDRWIRAQNLHDHERDEAWLDFHIRQPALYDFITERSESRFEPEIGELLVRTARFLWICERDGCRVRLNRPTIHATERENAPVLQFLSEASSFGAGFEERFEELVDHLGESVRNPTLFRLAFENIDDAHLERNPELDDFNFALLLFYVKVIMDCLEEA